MISCNTLFTTYTNSLLAHPSIHPVISVLAFVTISSNCYPSRYSMLALTNTCFIYPTLHHEHHKNFCMVTCFIRRIATCYCRSYSTSRLDAAMLWEVERTTNHLRLATTLTKKLALMSATKSHNVMTAVMKLLTPTPR